MAAVLAALPGHGAQAAEASRPETSRIQVEAFNLGAGLRLLVLPRFGLALSADFRQTGAGSSAQGYAHAGLVGLAAQPFYELTPYAVAGAAFALEQGQWPPRRAVPFATVGVQFEIFFAEYEVLLLPPGEGRFRWGLRLGL